MHHTWAQLLLLELMKWFRGEANEKEMIGDWNHYPTISISVINHQNSPTLHILGKSSDDYIYRIYIT